MHEHPDNVTLLLTDGKMAFTGADGKGETVEMKAGQAMWSVAQKHMGANAGPAGLEAIVVELKGAAAPKATLPASRPNMSRTTLVENPRADAYRITADAAFKEAPDTTHDYDQVLIALAPHHDVGRDRRQDHDDVEARRRRVHRARPEASGAEHQRQTSGNGRRRDQVSTPKAAQEAEAHLRRRTWPHRRCRIPHAQRAGRSVRAAGSSGASRVAAGHAAVRGAAGGRAAGAALRPLAALPCGPRPLGQARRAGLSSRVRLRRRRRTDRCRLRLLGVHERHPRRSRRTRRALRRQRDPLASRHARELPARCTS